MLRKNASMIAIPKLVMNDENELRKPMMNCAPLVTQREKNARQCGEIFINFIQYTVWKGIGLILDEQDQVREFTLDHLDIHREIELKI